MAREQSSFLGTPIYEYRGPKGRLAHLTEVCIAEMPVSVDADAKVSGGLVEIPVPLARAQA